MSRISLLAGTYEGAGQPSLFTLCADLSRRTLSRTGELAGPVKPSYLARTRDGRILTFTRTDKGGRILCLDAQGRELSSIPSGDAGSPCHISLGADERLVFAANYHSGSVTMSALSPEGILAPLDQVTHEGRGADPVRQSAPHCHCCLEQDGFLYVSDLGLDRIYVYRIDREAGKLLPCGRDISLHPGSGPRHLALSPAHPGLLYVITELSAEVIVCRLQEGAFSIAQTLSSVAAPSDPALELPPTADPDSIGGAIRVTDDGKYLFVSNRLGQQNVRPFRIGDDGLLTPLPPCGCSGITPRDIALLEGEEGVIVLCACQDSEEITALSFDRRSELLSPLPSMRLALPSPTCLVPVR